MNTKRHQFFKDRGLDIRDFFVYKLIQTLPYPITLQQIIDSSPFIDVKTRQMSQIIKTLTTANLVATNYNKFGISFIFPHISPATYRKRKRFAPCRISQGKVAFSSKISQVKPLYKYNNINKKTIYKKQYVVDKPHSVLARNNNLKIQHLKKIKEIFKASFPDKNNYIKSELPRNFSISLLINKLKESPFLMEKEFATLEWCIKHYEPIINDCYKEYKQKPAPPPPPPPDFSQREYTKEECNALFDDLDDIEL